MPAAMSDHQYLDNLKAVLLPDTTRVPRASDANAVGFDYSADFSLLVAPVCCLRRFHVDRLPEFLVTLGYLSRTIWRVVEHGVGTCIIQHLQEVGCIHVIGRIVGWIEVVGYRRYLILICERVNNHTPCVLRYQLANRLNIEGIAVRHCPLSCYLHILFHLSDGTSRNKHRLDGISVTFKV